MASTVLERQQIQQDGELGAAQQRKTEDCRSKIYQKHQIETDLDLIVLVALRAVGGLGEVEAVPAQRILLAEMLSHDVQRHTRSSTNRIETPRHFRHRKLHTA